MSIANDIKRIRPITNSSFTGVTNSSNFNFELIAEILSNLIDDLGLSGGTFDIGDIEVDNLHVNESLTVGPNNSFSVNNKGQVSAKTIKAEINEVKRLQFIDFPSYPTQGRLGEVIWTGTDFLGFTNFGWLSLTTVSGSGISPENFGIGIEDSGNHILSGVANINFNQNLKVSDEGDGTVKVDVTDMGVSVQNSGTKVLDTANIINFATELDVIDQGNGKIKVNNAGIYYVNSNATPEDIGGISSGTTFGPTDNNGDKYTIQDVFDILLYPYQSPSVSMSTNTNNILEIGASISSVTITWNMSNTSNIQDNTTDITDSSGESPLFTGLSKDNDSPQSYSYNTPVSYNSVSSHTWTVEAQDTQGNTFSDSDSTTWYFAVYHGTNSNTTLTESEIENLANKRLESSSSWKGNLSFAQNDYKYFAIPVSYNPPTSIKDADTGFAVAMADSSDGYNNFDGNYYFLQVSVTNQHGVQEDYRLYRTKNQISSDITLSIN